jgi:dienelactone hydrolase
MNIALKILGSFLLLTASMSLMGKVHSQNPAGIVELTITSSGDKMSGLIYLAAGKGPHPTVVLLHGYPGNEKNLDVAQALRTKGWNVLFFHYRGAWGSQGEFSFLNAEQDVQAVLAYINQPENAKRLKINRHNISLVGHSMGGHMAIAGILDNPAVSCAVAYDGANLGANSRGLFFYPEQPEIEKLWRDYSDSLFMLNGWSGAKAQQETKDNAVKLNLINRVEKINGRPVLFIPANTDVVPMVVHITPLVDALKATPHSQVFFQLIEDDHSFSSSRQRLIDTTAQFLNRSCIR